VSVSLLSQTYTTQADGSRHVVERYVDHLGGQYLRTYYIDAAADLAQRAIDGAQIIAAELAQREIDELLNNG